MKKICLLLLLSVFVFTATACGSGPKLTLEERSRPEATPRFSNADFRYGNISWNSSYSDIIREYGEPADVSVYFDDVWVTYEDVRVSDYSLNRITFIFASATGRLTEIDVSDGIFGTSNLSLKEAEKLSHAFEYKYAEPDKTEITREDGELNEMELIWENVYEKTYIRFYAGFNNSSHSVNVVIQYKNKDETNPIRHSDLPTPEPTRAPTPTPSPTPTPNLNGV